MDTVCAVALARLSGPPVGAGHCPWSRVAAAVLVLLMGHAAMAQGDPLDQAATAEARGDYATALRLLRPLADAGDAVAQRELGQMYSSGHGVPRDDAEALGWYRKAADQGDDVAEYRIGINYELGGENIPQDHAEAARWLQKAADKGNGPAQGMLGELFEMGWGVSRDFVQAHLWYSLAATRPTSETMDRQLAGEGRDRVSTEMTAPQLVEAHRLEREWKPK
jgi:TPR repeat protein